MNATLPPHPWKAVNRPGHYSGNPDLYEIQYGTDGECIAEVVHGIEAGTLLAAAPELLEALEHIMRYDRAGIGPIGDGLALAAIAKATGA